MTAFSRAKWIVPPVCPEDVNVYMIFRTKFTAGPAAPVLLRVSVFGNYAAYCGSELAAFGQYTDYPAKKTYSETDITRFCRQGENELEFSVWYSGQCFTSHIDGPVPGLLAEIVCGDEVLAASGTDWLCAWDTRYAMGTREKCSGSLNWTFEFDPDGMPTVFTQTAEVAEKFRRNVVRRPVEPAVILGKAAGTCIRSGLLYRDDETLPIGQRFMHDELDCGKEKANGSYAVFDLGTEVAGLLWFEAESEAGAILDVGHAEYLNGQNRLNVGFPGDRNFADRIHLKPGKTVFRHALRRLGARYLEFHIIGQARILSAGLDSVGFEAMRTIPEMTGLGAFWTKAREVSAETLRLCLHEKYENCPWREQSICMYDARNQMLFGYPLWGNYAHARGMLDLFGQSLREDGHLAIAVPSGAKFNIPNFTFLWFRAMTEYVLYSGDLSLAKEYAPQMRLMLGKILSRRKGNLYVPPAEDLWNYCDPPEMEYCADPPNAFYNLYLVFALRAASDLFRLTGDPAYADTLKSEAERLGAAAERFYFDPERNAYADHLDPGGERELFHGHTQMLFLAAGLIPEERRKAVLDTLRSGVATFPALSALPWLADGIFEFGGADDRAWFHGKLRSIYGAMLDAGAQTWWEVSLGKDYGAGAGSLCHGWSALPAHYIASRILGVRPLEPGFRTFIADPYLPEMDHVRGSVCTPFGPITVDLRRNADGTVSKIITCPPECRELDPVR